MRNLKEIKNEIPRFIRPKSQSDMGALAYAASLLRAKNAWNDKRGGRCAFGMIAKKKNIA